MQAGARAPRKGLKMVRNTDVGAADVSGLQRLIWKSDVQARADFSVPHLPLVEFLRPQGERNCFSRGEKQEEIRNGFQFRNLIKSQLSPSDYPYDIFSLASVLRILSEC